jgi:glycosyltransferase involved in cell wall biosynthesis
MKIIVFTTDVIPLPGLPTSGTALRTFGLARGLVSAGHEVVISVPKNALENTISKLDRDLRVSLNESLSELQELAFDDSNQAAIIARTNPDMILCGHWTAMMLGHKPRQLLVIDLAGPHILERHYQKSPDQLGAILAKLSVIACADYFIVSGKSQRLYFLSYLLRARISSPEKRIAQIAMPLDPIQPQKDLSATEPKGKTRPNFFFGGVFLPWQNPATSLRALSKILDNKPTGSLTLVGGKHPNYDIDEGIYQELFNELKANPKVDYHPFGAYEEFLRLLSKADVAIDLMDWNLERQLALTIRTTTYLWAGIPVIYNNYADLCPLIREYDAGWCVNPNDPSELNRIVDEIYQNPSLLKAKSENAYHLASKEFSWDKAIAPLLNLIEGASPVAQNETDIAINFPDRAEYFITEDKTIKQDFLCRLNGLSKIECRFATHGRIISSETKLKLFSKNNQLVAEQIISPAELRNNEWLSFDFLPISESAGKEFTLEISSNEKSLEHSLSPWTLKGTPYPLSRMRYANQNVPLTSLCLRTTCSNKNLD